MRHDYVLLAVGFCRVGLWVLGVFGAFYRKRPLALVGFGLAVFSSTVIAFNAAHFDVPDSLLPVTTFLSPLIPACIITSFLLHGVSNKHWRL